MCKPSPQWHSCRNFNLPVLDADLVPGDEPGALHRIDDGPRARVGYHRTLGYVGRGAGAIRGEIESVTIRDGCGAQRIGG